MATGNQAAAQFDGRRPGQAEVGVFFDGVGPDASERELAAAAPKHSFFRLLAPTG